MIQHSYNKNSVCIIFVPSVGLEPTRLTTYAPKAYVATNYTMKAFFVEQIPGIEPGFHPYQGCIITNYMITAFVLREGLEPSRQHRTLRLKHSVSTIPPSEQLLGMWVTIPLPSVCNTDALPIELIPIILVALVGNDPTLFTMSR